MSVETIYSVLNIAVCIAIIAGCIYAMYRLIKNCRSIENIKNSQGEVVGSKKKGSVLKTICLSVFLFLIAFFATVIGILHIFNIITIS